MKENKYALQRFLNSASSHGPLTPKVTKNFMMIGKELAFSTEHAYNNIVRLLMPLNTK